eukprot:g12175.t1
MKRKEIRDSNNCPFLFCFGKFCGLQKAQVVKESSKLSVDVCSKFFLDFPSFPGSEFWSQTRFLYSCGFCSKIETRKRETSQSLKRVLILKCSAKAKYITQRNQFDDLQCGVSSTPTATTPAVNPLSRLESGRSAAIESDSKQSSANTNLYLVDPSSKTGATKLIHVYAQGQGSRPCLLLQLRCMSAIVFSIPRRGWYRRAKGRSLIWATLPLCFIAVSSLAVGEPYRIDVWSCRNTDSLTLDFRPNKNARRLEPHYIPGFGPSQPLSDHIIAKKHKNPRVPPSQPQSDDINVAPPKKQKRNEKSPPRKKQKTRHSVLASPAETKLGDSLPGENMNPGDTGPYSSPYSALGSAPIASSSSVTSQLPASSDLSQPSTSGHAVTSYATASELLGDDITSDATGSSFPGNRLQRGVSASFSTDYFHPGLPSNIDSLPWLSSCSQADSSIPGSIGSFSDGYASELLGTISRPTLQAALIGLAFFEKV